MSLEAYPGDAGLTILLSAFPGSRRLAACNRALLPRRLSRALDLVSASDHDMAANELADGNAGTGAKWAQLDADQQASALAGEPGNRMSVL
jgi:hypothetical protein